MSTQYTEKKGEIDGWKDTQVMNAQLVGLGLMFSINVLRGHQRHSVPADSLEEWGRVLASPPYASGLLMWSWDNPDRDGDGEDYFANRRSSHPPDSFQSGSESQGPAARWLIMRDRDAVKE